MLNFDPSVFEKQFLKPYFAHDILNVLDFSMKHHHYHHSRRPHIIINIIIIILITILIADLFWLFWNFLRHVLWYCIFINPHHTPLTIGGEFRCGKHASPIRIESHYELPRWTIFHCCHCKSTELLNGEWHMRHLLHVFRFRVAEVLLVTE
jgi:hypothetical protein